MGDVAINEGVKSRRTDISSNVWVGRNRGDGSSYIYTIEPG